VLQFFFIKKKKTRCLCVTVRQNRSLITKVGDTPANDWVTLKDQDIDLDASEKIGDAPV